MGCFEYSSGTVSALTQVFWGARAVTSLRCVHLGVRWAGVAMRVALRCALPAGLESCASTRTAHLVFTVVMAGVQELFLVYLRLYLHFPDSLCFLNIWIFSFVKCPFARFFAHFFLLGRLPFSCGFTAIVYIFLYESRQKCVCSDKDQ